MWKLAGALLLATALAQAGDEARTQTVEDAVRSYLGTAGDIDVAREGLSDRCMAASGPAPVTITGAPDSLLAASADAARPQAFAAFPFPGSQPYRYLTAVGTTHPWEITGALGFTLTDGNSDTITLTVGADAKREWELWKLAMKLGILYAESESEQTASEWIFFERLERKLSERATIFQDLLLEHDEEEDLRYRIQFTVGYNRRLVKNETFELWGNIGGGILYESFFDGSDTEGIAQVGINFTWQITKQLLYTQVITLYPSLSNGGEYRLYWESVFTTPISGRMDLRLSIIDRYDSDPQVGVEENDLTIALSIAIRFTEPPPK